MLQQDPQRASSSLETLWPTGHEPAGRAALRQMTVRLFLSDLLVVVLALGAAQIVRFGQGSSLVAGTEVRYTTIGGLLALCWIGSLVARGAYRHESFGHGHQEYVSVTTATVQMFAAVALLSYVFKWDLARGYVLMALPSGLVLLVLSRMLWRRWLLRRRARGELCVRVLAVGDVAHLQHLITSVRRVPGAGYSVVEVCTDQPVSEVSGVPVHGGLDSVSLRALERDIDVVAWAGNPDEPDTLRRLGWALERSDVRLAIAPGLMSIAGPRVTTQAIAGLPLLHVEMPTFSGPSLRLKLGLDRVISALVLLVLAPVLLLVALAVKAGDRGPVFYRQTRIGREGRAFRMWKYRTMRTGADTDRAVLGASNDGNGVLFKRQRDPRVTKVGRVLRRFSIDELPQLLNVLAGQMSLVGPRPPLPEEVEGYERDVRRRLLVLPGMTGLWQINGRSDLSWEETIRLDLYYVENWSVLGDVMILLRTVSAVVRGRGAY